jgi:hypothetical protein
MLCNDQSIKIIGNKIDYKTNQIFILDDYPTRHSYDLISVHYNGTITFDGLNITGNFDCVAKTQDWFYFLDISKDGSVVSKLNTNTHENQKLVSIPSKVSKPLLIPFNNDIYLIGGGVARFGMRHDVDHGEFKTLNHKITQQFIMQS